MKPVTTVGKPVFSIIIIFQLIYAPLFAKDQGRSNSSQVMMERLDQFHEWGKLAGKKSVEMDYHHENLEKYIFKGAPSLEYVSQMKAGLGAFETLMGLELQKALSEQNLGAQIYSDQKIFRGKGLEGQEFPAKLEEKRKNLEDIFRYFPEYVSFKRSTKHVAKVASLAARVTDAESQLDYEHNLKDYYSEQEILEGSKLAKMLEEKVANPLIKTNLNYYSFLSVHKRFESQGAVTGRFDFNLYLKHFEQEDELEKEENYYQQISANFPHIRGLVASFFARELKQYYQKRFRPFSLERSNSKATTIIRPILESILDEELNSAHDEKSFASLFNRWKRMKYIQIQNQRRQELPLVLKKQDPWKKAGLSHQIIPFSRLGTDLAAKTLVSFAVVVAGSIVLGTALAVLPEAIAAASTFTVGTWAAMTPAQKFAGVLIAGAFAVAETVDEAKSTDTFFDHGLNFSWNLGKHLIITFISMGLFNAAYLALAETAPVSAQLGIGSVVTLLMGSSAYSHYQNEEYCQFGMSAFLAFIAGYSTARLAVTEASARAYDALQVWRFRNGKSNPFLFEKLNFLGNSETPIETEAFNFKDFALSLKFRLGKYAPNMAKRFTLFDPVPAGEPTNTNPFAVVRPPSTPLGPRGGNVLEMPSGDSGGLMRIGPGYSTSSVGPMGYRAPVNTPNPGMEGGSNILVFPNQRGITFQNEGGPLKVVNPFSKPEPITPTIPSTGPKESSPLWATIPGFDFTQSDDMKQVDGIRLTQAYTGYIDTKPKKVIYIYRKGPDGQNAGMLRIEIDPEDLVDERSLREILQRKYNIVLTTNDEIKMPQSPKRSLPSLEQGLQVFASNSVGGSGESKSSPESGNKDEKKTSKSYNPKFLQVELDWLEITNENVARVAETLRKEPTFVFFKDDKGNIHFMLTRPDPEPLRPNSILFQAAYFINSKTGEWIFGQKLSRIKGIGPDVFSQYAIVDLDNFDYPFTLVSNSGNLYFGNIIKTYVQKGSNSITSADVETVFKVSKDGPAHTISIVEAGKSMNVNGSSFKFGDETGGLKQHRGNAQGYVVPTMAGQPSFQSDKTGKITRKPDFYKGLREQNTGAQNSKAASSRFGIHADRANEGFRGNVKGPRMTRALPRGYDGRPISSDQQRHRQTNQLANLLALESFRKIATLDDKKAPVNFDKAAYPIRLPSERVFIFVDIRGKLHVGNNLILRRPHSSTAERRPPSTIEVSYRFGSRRQKLSLEDIMPNSIATIGQPVEFYRSDEGGKVSGTLNSFRPADGKKPDRLAIVVDGETKSYFIDKIELTTFQVKNAEQRLWVEEDTQILKELIAKMDSLALDLVHIGNVEEAKEKIRALKQALATLQMADQAAPSKERQEMIKTAQKEILNLHGEIGIKNQGYDLSDYNNAEKFCVRHGFRPATGQNYWDASYTGINKFLEIAQHQIRWLEQKINPTEAEEAAIKKLKEKKAGIHKTANLTLRGVKAIGEINKRHKQLFREVEALVHDAERNETRLSELLSRNVEVGEEVLILDELENKLHGIANRFISLVAKLDQLTRSTEGLEGDSIELAKKNNQNVAAAMRKVDISLTAQRFSSLAAQLDVAIKSSDRGDFDLYNLKQLFGLKEKLDNIQVLYNEIAIEFRESQDEFNVFQIQTALRTRDYLRRFQDIVYQKLYDESLINPGIYSLYLETIEFIAEFESKRASNAKHFMIIPDLFGRAGLLKTKWSELGLIEQINSNSFRFHQNQERYGKKNDSGCAQTAIERLSEAFDFLRVAFTNLYSRINNSGNYQEALGILERRVKDAKTTLDDEQDTIDFLKKNGHEPDDVELANLEEARKAYQKAAEDLQTFLSDHEQPEKDE